MTNSEQVNLQIASTTELVETAFSRQAWTQILGALEVGIVGAEFPDAEERERVGEWIHRLYSV